MRQNDESLLPSRPQIMNDIGHDQHSTYSSTLKMLSTTFMYFDILHVNFMYRYALLVENSEGPGQLHLWP